MPVRARTFTIFQSVSLSILVSSLDHLSHRWQPQFQGSNEEKTASGQRTEVFPTCHFLLRKKPFLRRLRRDTQVPLARLGQMFISQLQERLGKWLLIRHHQHRRFHGKKSLWEGLIGSVCHEYLKVAYTTKPSAASLKMSRASQFQGCFRGSPVNRTQLPLSLYSAILPSQLQDVATAPSIIFTQYIQSHKGKVASLNHFQVFTRELLLSKRHSAHLP